MKITRQNFWPEGVALPPKKLLPAFKAMLAHLESGAHVKYMCWTIASLVGSDLGEEFEDYVQDQYLYPNVGTNNFYNFYRELYFQETGKEFENDPGKKATELRIEWLKAAIANIESRSLPRKKKLSDTKVYKTLKKGLADDPSEFQKVYKGLKWAWDNYPLHMTTTREVAFNKGLSYIAYWANIPGEGWDYWHDLADKFFPGWDK